MAAGEKDAFYLTTPIYYVNDAPHIGHAYTTTAGDVATRWRRQRGEQVWFLTGVDEHGTKVQRAADAGGVTPQQWVDQLVEDACGADSPEMHEAAVTVLQRLYGTVTTTEAVIEELGAKLVSPR